MATPAALCDPFAALLLHHKKLSTQQASLGESMVNDPMTTEGRPLISRSHIQVSRKAPSPSKSVGSFTDIPNSPHHLRNLQPSTADNRECTYKKTNMNDGVLVEMKPAMAQRIIEALHQFIQEERLRNFSFLGRTSHYFTRQEDLLVVSAASQDDIKDASSHHHDLTAYDHHNWFAFRQPSAYNSSCPTVIISVPEDTALSADELTIIEPCARGSFTSTPAVAWLLEKYNWEDAGAMKFSQEQYNEQFLWWSCNTKAFRLLDLPSELRDAIYLQVIGPIILPDLRDSRTIFGRGLSYGDAVGSQKNRDPDVEAPNMAIMRVNHQVWSEVTRVATQDSQKRLRAIGYYNLATAKRGPCYSASEIVTTWLTSAPQAGFFRKLQLEMSAASYFESIGFTPTAVKPLAKGEGTFSLSALKNFTALRELDLRFIGPKHPDAVCPWALIRNTSGKGEHSCQKLWIDYFFTLGWDLFRDLRHSNTIRYTLSGCIKTSSRQRWERLLNAKDNSHTNAIKEGERRIRQQKIDSLPLACECSTPCSRAGADMVTQTYKWSQYDIGRIAGLQEHIDDIYWSFKD